jgi:low temperature requirement protein LtrA
MSHRHPASEGWPPASEGWPNEGVQAIETPAGVLHAAPRQSTAVQPVELFFDLVYVLAITQITHYLLEHLTLRGAAEALLLYLAVWRGWVRITWVSNYFEVRGRPIRIMLILLTLASLIVSASLPEAFDGRGLAVAVGFGFVMSGAAAFAVVAAGREHPLRMVFERLLAWDLVTGLLFVAGGLVGGDARFVTWLCAIVIAYTVTWFGFPFPRLGHSHTTDYTLTGEHIAERCLLFVTIALGESIIITGSNFGELPNATERWAALVVAFVASGAIWWTYFDRGAEAGREVISSAEDPGRLGLIAYTYCHIPIVAGIIVAAAGDEIAIAHPGQDVSTGEAALILGGPALYLVGHSLFKLAVWGHLSPSRAAGVLALGALVPLAMVSSALVLIVAATVVLVGVVLWDLVIERRRLLAEAQAEAVAVKSGGSRVIEAIQRR